MYDTGDCTYTANVTPTVGEGSPLNALEDAYCNVVRQFGQPPRRLELSTDLMNSFEKQIEEMRAAGLLVVCDPAIPYDFRDRSSFIGRYKGVDLIHNPSLSPSTWRYYVPPFTPYFAASLLTR